MLFKYTHDRPAKRRLLEHVRTLRTAVGIVFSRVARSSEIQVEERRGPPPSALPTPAFPRSPFRFLQDSGRGWVEGRNRISRIPADVRTITGAKKQRIRRAGVRRAGLRGGELEAQGKRRGIKQT